MEMKKKEIKGEEAEGVGEEEEIQRGGELRKKKKEREREEQATRQVQ